MLLLQHEQVCGLSPPKKKTQRVLVKPGPVRPIPDVN